MPRKKDEAPLAGIDLKPSGAVPLYIQIYTFFKDSILSKRLRNGQKLPGTRSLAAELGVSRNTVSLAFEQLIIEGYIEGRRGSGTYVSRNIPDHNFPNLSRTQSKFKASPPTLEDERLKGSLSLMSGDIERDNIIPFQTGTPALFDFPMDIWNKISNSIIKNINPVYLGYGYSAGYGPLRTALAEYLRTYRAVKCEADQIIIVNGSQQALDLIAKILLTPKSVVWIEDPGYLGARAAITPTNAAIYPVPLDGEGMDINYAIKKYPKPDLIYTTPSHQYPLGCTMSISRRLKLLEWCQNNKVWILEDDYDSEYRYAGNPLPSLQGLSSGSGVIYTGTFSKVLFPGLRLGYIVLPSPKIVVLFKAAKAISDRQSAIIEQMITAEFIGEGHFTKHIRKMRILYKERQDFLVQEAKKELGDIIHIEGADAGMQLIAWLPEHYDDKEIQKRALTRNLVVRPLSELSMQFPAGPGLILGYTAFNKNEIRAGIKKLAEVFREYRI